MKLEKNEHGFGLSDSPDFGVASKQAEKGFDETCQGYPKCQHHHDVHSLFTRLIKKHKFMFHV